MSIASALLGAAVDHVKTKLTEAMDGNSQKATQFIDKAGEHIQNSGGISGFVNKLASGGLKDVADSFVGTGPNKECPGNALAQAVPWANDLAKACGVDINHVGNYLGTIVDAATPNGKLPS